MYTYTYTLGPYSDLTFVRNKPRLGYSLAYASGTNYGQFLLFAGSTKSTAILYEHFKHLKLNNFRNKLYLSMKISVYKKISYCL